jgi:hypothetical protein
VVNDISHRIAEATGGVHGNEYERGIALGGIGETLVNVVREDWRDDTVELKFEDQRG